MEAITQVGKVLYTARPTQWAAALTGRRVVPTAF
jgi:hypothetical protein